MRKGFDSKKFLGILVGCLCVFLATCQTGNDDDDNNTRLTVTAGTQIILTCIAEAGCGQTETVEAASATVEDFSGSWRTSLTGSTLVFRGTQGIAGLFEFTDQNGVTGDGSFQPVNGNVIVSINDNASQNPFFQLEVETFSIDAISQEEITLTLLSREEASSALQLLEMTCVGTCGDVGRTETLDTNNANTADLTGTWDLTVAATESVPETTFTFTIFGSGAFTATDSTGGQSEGQFSIVSDLVTLNFTTSTNPLVELGSVQFFRVIAASTSKFNLQEIPANEASLNFAGLSFEFNCASTCGTSENDSLQSPLSATTENVQGIWQSENIPGLPFLYIIQADGAFSFTDQANDKTGAGTFSINAGVATINVTSSDSSVLPVGLQFFRIDHISSTQIQITEEPLDGEKTLFLSCDTSCVSAGTVTPVTVRAENLVGTWTTTQGPFSFTIVNSNDSSFSLSEPDGGTGTGSYGVTNSIFQLSFMSNTTQSFSGSSAVGFVVAAIDAEQLVLLIDF